MKKLNAIDWIVVVLVIIGALNWGVVSIFNVDVLMPIFGSAARLVYGLIGIAGIYMIFTAMKFGKTSMAAPMV